MYCDRCGNIIPEGTNTCSICGNVMQSPVTGMNVPLQPIAFVGMGWFKFLIYFSLIAGAVLNFLSALGFITGSIYASQSNYTVTADIVYAFYGNGLRIVDIARGASLIALGVFAIITRSKLAKYKKDGPRSLIGLYIYSVASVVIYLFACYLIIGELAIEDIAVNLIVNIVMIVVNKIYFGKRKFLFVN